MNLQSFIQTRLLPLTEQKISVSRPAGRLEFERRGKYTANEVMELANRPTSESLFLKRRLASQKQAFNLPNGLELEGTKTHKTETTVADAVKEREDHDKQGFQEIRGMVEKRDGDFVGLSMSIKL